MSRTAIQDPYWQFVKYVVNGKAADPFHRPGKGPVYFVQGNGNSGPNYPYWVGAAPQGGGSIVLPTGDKYYFLGTADFTIDSSMGEYVTLASQAGYFVRMQGPGVDLGLGNYATDTNYKLMTLTVTRSDGTILINGLSLSEALRVRILPDPPADPGILPKVFIARHGTKLIVGINGYSEIVADIGNTDLGNAATPDAVAPIAIFGYGGGNDKAGIFSYFRFTAGVCRYPTVGTWQPPALPLSLVPVADPVVRQVTVANHTFPIGRKTPK